VQIAQQTLFGGRFAVVEIGWLKFDQLENGGSGEPGDIDAMLTNGFSDGTKMVRRQKDEIVAKKDATKKHKKTLQVLKRTIDQ